MPKHFSRRELLKLGSLLPLAYNFPAVLRKPASQPPASVSPNILVLVFDAFSANNISLYGYPRKTTPNLDRLAQRATVFHNHYAPGNYTITGTSSILSGMYPWTTRALSFFTKIPKSLHQRNVFNLFSDYYNLAYTHNILANHIINIYGGEINEHQPLPDLYLQNDGFIEEIFRNDADTATLSWLRLMKKQEKLAGSYSLFLSEIYRSLKNHNVSEWEKIFPIGLPNILVDNYFVLETAIDWTIKQLNSISQPFLSYLHFLPPHEPYRPRIEFYNQFRGDGYKPANKAHHILHDKAVDPKFLERQHRFYDEYILYVDAEFNRLFNALEANGILDTTWVIVTSDHGEIFERGFIRHEGLSVHQPVIHVPLLVFEPGQSKRQDIFTNTSSVDILPTLLEISKKSIPGWIEGKSLPLHPAQSQDEDISVFAFDSKFTELPDPIRRGSSAIIKNRYKLLYFFNYSELGQPDLIELYDLENDPEELNDLSKTQSSLAGELLAELKSRLAQADEPYRTNQ